MNGKNAPARASLLTLPFVVLCLAVAGACDSSGDDAAGEPEIKYGTGVPDAFGSGTDTGGSTPVTDSGSSGPKDTGAGVGGDMGAPADTAVGDDDAPDITGGTGQTDVDVTITAPDGACIPQCDGKLCGPDGCGNICGFCLGGFACKEGECVPVCDPFTPCEGKVCGPDGCGGQCGSCDPNFDCGQDGQCYPGDCQPLCEGKVCGPDKCGGQCGICPGVKLCDTDTGLCEDNPCDDIGEANACDGKDILLQCVDMKITETDCTEENPIWGCTWIKNDQKYGCAKPPECEPDCTDKQCGTDGCGGTCGAGCFANWSCEEFTCVPQPGGACGTITAAGKCINGADYFCTNGTISIEDCQAAGKKCAWNGDKSSYECKSL